MTNINLLLSYLVKQCTITCFINFFDIFYYFILKPQKSGKENFAKTKITKIQTPTTPNTCTNIFILCILNDSLRENIFKVHPQ